MSLLRCAMRTLRTCARRLCSHIVPAALDGLRVDVVSSRMSQRSRNRCGRLIAGGGLRVDGSPVRAAARRVRAGQRLDIDASVAFSDSAVHAEPSVPLALLHEDEHLVVVDKPAGIACHPVPGHSTGTLLNGLNSSLGTIIGGVLSPILDPLVNTLLSNLGVNLNAVEVGANLSGRPHGQAALVN